ncbi:MAG: hypothetical protein V1647_04520 [Pseudomonadota bacterium]
MKRIITAVMFLGSIGLVMAAADYQGYSKFLKDNESELKKMDTACKATDGVLANANECNRLAKKQLKAQCDFGVNPNACKAIKTVEEAKKHTPEKKN